MDLARGANDAQLALRISTEVADIQGRLLDVQQQALSLQEENRALRDDLRKTQEALALRNRVHYEEEAYWEETNGKQDGPFGPSCWDLDGKLVRPSKSHNSSAEYQVFFCSHHTPYVTLKVPHRLLTSRRG